MMSLTANLQHLPREAKIRAIEILREQQRRDSRRQFYKLFPDEGELRRELYPRHLEFFEAGKKHKERCFMAGNRVGKTVGAGYELTCHMTGEYPDWWDGLRYDKPVRVLAAGDTGATTRDIIQNKLIGPYDDIGTGMIPGDLIHDMTPKRGLPNAVEEVLVKHVPTGGYSRMKFRSYDQGRRIFQGTEEDIIWFDEECPEDVYDEALIRTMTTGGITMLTFTPLSGLTPLVISFLQATGEM